MAKKSKLSNYYSGKLPKAQVGNYIFDPLVSKIASGLGSFMRGMMGGNESSTKPAFDYNTYLNSAQKYLNRPVFKGTSLKAKDIADAAMDFYNKTGYQAPLEMILTQGQMESGLGTKLKSKYNYFNIGNTDEGLTKDYPSAKQSVGDYLNLMYNDYLQKGEKSFEDLLKPKGFINAAGNRYASDPVYEEKIKNQLNYVKKFLNKKGYGGLHQYQTDGTVGPDQPYHPITNPTGYRVSPSDALAIARRNEQRAVQTGPQIGQYNKVYDVQRKQSAQEYARSQAQRNSALAQTMGLFTPTGDNVDAGVIGAETTVNMNPLITGPIMSTSRLYGAGRSMFDPKTFNPYFSADNSIGQNILGALALSGDLGMLKMTTRTPSGSTYNPETVFVEELPPSSRLAARNQRVTDSWFNKKAGIPSTAEEYMQFLKQQEKGAEEAAKNQKGRTYYSSQNPTAGDRLVNLAQYGEQKVPTKLDFVTNEQLFNEQIFMDEYKKHIRDFTNMGYDWKDAINHAVNRTLDNLKNHPDFDHNLSLERTFQKLTRGANTYNPYHKDFRPEYLWSRKPLGSQAKGVMRANPSNMMDPNFDIGNKNIYVFGDELANYVDLNSVVSNQIKHYEDLLKMADDAETSSKIQARLNKLYGKVPKNLDLGETYRGIDAWQNLTPNKEGGLQKYQTKGTVYPWMMDLGQTTNYSTDADALAVMQRAAIAAETKRKMDAGARENARRTFVGPATPESPQSKKRRYELNKQRAFETGAKFNYETGDIAPANDPTAKGGAWGKVQTPALVQTAAMATPSGRDYDAATAGSEVFVNMNPITAPITSSGRLTQLAVGQNPYGFNSDGITSNILPALGVLGDVAGVGSFKMLPGSKSVTNAPVKIANATRKALGTESGLLSNIPSPRSVIVSKMLNNSKLNTKLADRYYANRILEEELIGPNVSYKGTPNFPEGKTVWYSDGPFLQRNGRMYYMSEFENGIGLSDETYMFMPRPDHPYPSKHIKKLQKKYNVSDAAPIEFDDPYKDYFKYDEEVTPIDDWIIHNDLGKLTGDKTWWLKSQPYSGMFKRSIFDKPFGRHLFAKQSALESSLGRPLDTHRELLGDVLQKGVLPRKNITITPTTEMDLPGIEGLKSFSYNPLTKSMERGIFTNPSLQKNYYQNVGRYANGGDIKYEIPRFDIGGPGSCPANMYWDTVKRTCVPRPAPYITSDINDFNRRNQLASDSTNAAINSAVSIKENDLNSFNEKTITANNARPTLSTSDKSYKDKKSVAKSVTKYKNQPLVRHTTQQYKDKLIKEGNDPKAVDEFVDQSASVISGNQIINPVAITDYHVDSKHYDEKGNLVDTASTQYAPEFQEAKQKVEFNPSFAINYVDYQGKQQTVYVKDYDSWKKLKDRFSGSRAFQSSEEDGSKSAASLSLGQINTTPLEYLKTDKIESPYELTMYTDTGKKNINLKTNKERQEYIDKWNADPNPEYSIGYNGVFNADDLFDSKPSEKVKEPIEEVFPTKKWGGSANQLSLGTTAKQGKVINDDRGQWAHPGKNTRVFSPSITMDGVPYPVEAHANTGQKIIMQPGQDYYFPGADYVDEYPMMQKGGTLPPIYTNDPNDPRLKAHGDSAVNFQRYPAVGFVEHYDHVESAQERKENLKKYRESVKKNPKFKELFKNAEYAIKQKQYPAGVKYSNEWVDLGGGTGGHKRTYVYDKPKQPVIYREATLHPKRGAVKNERESQAPEYNILPLTRQVAGDISGKVNMSTPYRVDYTDESGKRASQYFPSEKEGSQFMQELQSRPIGIGTGTTGYYDRKYGGNIMQGGGDISIPVLAPKIPKYQKKGTVKHYVFPEDPNAGLPGPRTTSAFIQEAKNLQTYIGKNYPNEEVVIMPGYGKEYFDKQVVPTLGKITKDDRVYILGHHGSRYAGIPNDLWGDALEQAQRRAGDFNCYLGSCSTNDLVGVNDPKNFYPNPPSFSRVSNFYYRPDRPWLGINPNAPAYGDSRVGVLDAMFSRTYYHPDTEKYYRERENYYDNKMDIYYNSKPEVKKLNKELSELFDKARGEGGYYTEQAAQQRWNIFEKLDSLKRIAESKIIKDPKYISLDNKLSRTTGPRVTKDIKYGIDYAKKDKFNPYVHQDKRVEFKQKNPQEYQPTLGEMLNYTNLQYNYGGYVSKPSKKSMKEGGLLKDYYNMKIKK